ncbi:MAG: hypothetical protein AAF206_17505 [Bacteroidota bacterium]
MYFSLPIEINQRRLHKCRLVAASVSTHDHYQFVVPMRNGKSSELFRIESNQNKRLLECSDGFQFDQKIDRHFHFAWHPVSRTIELHLNQRSGDVQDNQAGWQRGESIDDATHGLWLGRISNGLNRFSLVGKLDNNQLAGQSVSFQICYHHPTSQKTYRYAMRFFPSSAQTACYAMALDFGSEASQAAAKRIDEVGPQFLDLLEILKGPDFYNFPHKTAEDFLQFGSENGYPLLRSNFFLNLSHQQFTITDKPSRHHSVQILADRKDTESPLRRRDQYQLLPNIKLSELVGGHTMKLKLGRHTYFDQNMRENIRRSVINQLLHACLHQIGQRHDTDEAAGVLIHLLIPNLYDQKRAFDLISQTYQDVALFMQEYGIGGVEILTMSESDASFCGYFSRLLKHEGQSLVRPKKQQSRYMIIDAGKGTIDLSILEPMDEAGTEFRSVYQAGIAGSGQYLSFAVMEALSHQLCIPMRKLLDLFNGNGHPNEVLDFMDLVEAYKKLGGVIHTGDEQIYGPFRSDISLRNLILNLQNRLAGSINPNLYLVDPYAVVDTAVEKLCERIQRLLDHSGLDTDHFTKVFLTGRAFYLKPFEAGIQRLLGGKVDSLSDIIFDREFAKQICLWGPLAHECRINYHADVFGALLLRRTFSESAGRKVKKRFLSWFYGEEPQATPPTHSTSVFRLGKDFFFGQAEENDYIPDSGDQFFIGDQPQKLGSLGNGFPAEVIEQQEPLKMSVELEGYVIRFPKGHSNVSIVSNHQHDSPHPEDNGLRLKSIFPFGSIEALQNQYPLTDSFGAPPPVSGGFNDFFGDDYSSQSKQNKPSDFFDASLVSQPPATTSLPAIDVDPGFDE